MTGLGCNNKDVSEEGCEISCHSQGLQRFINCMFPSKLPLEEATQIQLCIQFVVYLLKLNF